MMYFKLDLLLPCVSPNEHRHHTVFQTVPPCWTRRTSRCPAVFELWRLRLLRNPLPRRWGGNLRSQMCCVAQALCREHSGARVSEPHAFQCVPDWCRFGRDRGKTMPVHVFLIKLLTFGTFFRPDRENHRQSRACCPYCHVWEERLPFQGIRTSF